MTEQIVILDFGSQYTQVIARRIRECNVYCTILPFSTPAKEIAALTPRGLVLSGGPASVYADDAPHPDRNIFKLDVPVLGICYGLQILAHYLGGEVGRGVCFWCGTKCGAVLGGEKGGGGRKGKRGRGPREGKKKPRPVVGPPPG